MTVRYHAVSGGDAVTVCRSAAAYAALVAALRAYGVSVNTRTGEVKLTATGERVGSFTVTR